MKKIFKLIKKAIKGSKTIGLFGHKSSDADCIGSLLSLYYALISINKDVEVYVEDISSNLKKFDRDNIIKTSLPNKKFDLIITVDSATKKQLGKFSEMINRCSKSIMIDHHSTRENYADICLVNSFMPSTCDLLFELYKYLKIKFDKQIDTLLFAGIMGDTGRLMYSQNNVIPYKHCLFLITNGADTNFVHNCLYRSITKQTFSLKQKMYNMAIIKSKYAVCIISNSELPKNNFTTDDFVNDMLSIDNIIVSILCVEKKRGIYNVSIRTKGELSASDIAKQLGGGGHFNAAGASITSNSKEYVKNVVLKLIAKHLKV